MTQQDGWTLGPVPLVLASAVFFAVIGPVVGATVFIPAIGSAAALMVAHAFGLIPALATGLWNGAVLLAGVADSRSWRGRLAHATIGGLGGLLATTVYLDYPDWVLLRRAVDGYEFWYTFNRDYAGFCAAGVLAGAVCSFAFNPWAQRHRAFRR